MSRLSDIVKDFGVDDESVKRLLEKCVLKIARRKGRFRTNSGVYQNQDRKRERYLPVNMVKN